MHVSGHGLADRGHEDHDVDERIGALSAPFGKQQRAAARRCIAGDLACVAKLTRAETGDTLSAKDDPLLMEPWTMPDPLLPLAIQAHSKADEDKLSQGLARLVAEDPTMRLEQNQDTHQVVLWCLGEAHADVALERLRSRYGVQVDVVPHKVSLRETFGGQVGRARPACQAVRRARPVRDLRDRGGAAAGGLGHRVRRQGRRRRGAAAVHPVRGEGRTGPGGARASRPAIRSSTCGSRCSTARRTRWTPPTPRSRRRARSRCARPPPTRRSICWSRWPRCACWSRDEYVGPVMSDLSGRRGRVVGTEQAGGGRTLVRAEVPEIEIGRYAVDLRSLSHGTGALQPLVRPARADAAAGRRQGSANRRRTARER